MRVASAAQVLLLSLLVAAPALAQTSAKISGRVTDAATGQPLPGASVLVLETTRGATTAADGFYTILSVPVGRPVDVRVSFIGYRTQIVQGVSVSIDQTSTVNVALSEEDGTIGEVVVRAERPIVELDVSNSRANISADQLEAIPASTISAVVGLQAGIQGAFGIRGSGSDEISFQVNGLTLRDERNNAPFTNISLTSVQEVQVQTGGFNAEYGNVRSGVVNVVTKEGSTTRYEADVIVRMSPPTPKNFGGMPNDPDSYWIRPFIDPAVAFTGTDSGAWDATTRSQYRGFEGWNAVSRSLLADDDPTNDMTPEALRQAFLYQHRKSFEITQPDYEVDMGIGGPVPGVSRLLGNLRFFGTYRRSQNQYVIPLNTAGYTDETGHLKLTSDLRPGMKLSLEGRIGQNRGTGASRSGQPGFFQTAAGIGGELNNVSFIDSRIFSTDYWGPLTTNYSQVGASFTYTPTSNSVLQVRANRFQARYDGNPGRRRDRAPVVTIGGVTFDEGPFGWEPFPSDGVNGLRMGVGMSNSRDSSSVAYTNVQADFTRQVNRFLEFKTGLEVNLTESRMNYGQVDSFLTGSNFNVRWDRRPVRGALFAQTKLEFQGMIANVGLRGDYSHARGVWYDFETFDRVLSGVPLTATGDPQPSLDSLLTTRPTDRIFAISPRLGVSFPVSATSKLYVNYGHFRQTPTADDLYLVRALAQSGQINRIANPNSPLPKTVAYELGYEQGFFDQYTARLAGYYKDVALDPRLVTYQSRTGAVTYSLSEPNQYADIRGFELTLSRVRGWLQGFANYTYQVTTSGFFEIGRAHV